MGLIETLGKKFIITTELGPVKGVLTEEALTKAKDYLPLDGINIHDCPMGNLRINAIAMGIRNLLVTTGDPPKHGPYPSKAVYDYNTFELIRLIKKLNAGVDYNDKEFGGKTDFTISCTAIPTSRDMNRELERMEKKISAGADFFQTQVVYDAQKTIAFLEKAKPLNTKIIIGLMPLKSVKMARFMDKNVEGIDVPDSIIARME
ncbi:MAG: methylenetetrahydrofolate reductase, partial [Proteobacteria bacterium]|nr:methylenetetrahydrofolate reductase [Pseudomonadota bacterium]